MNIRSQQLHPAALAYAEEVQAGICEWAPTEGTKAY